MTLVVVPRVRAHLRARWQMTILEILSAGSAVILADPLMALATHAGCLAFQRALFFLIQGWHRPSFPTQCAAPTLMKYAGKIKLVLRRSNPLHANKKIPPLWRPEGGDEVEELGSFLQIKLLNIPLREVGLDSFPFTPDFIATPLCEKPVVASESVDVVRVGNGPDPDR